MSASSRGASRERQVRKLLESEGWAVTRGAGSHGSADLWAGKAHWSHGMRVKKPELRLIQVKTDRSGPYANFRPAERRELLALAKQTGGQAELHWWPARGKRRILLESDWPPLDRPNKS
jgi:Holliday junction resolvase